MLKTNSLTESNKMADVTPTDHQQNPETRPENGASPTKRRPDRKHGSSKSSKSNVVNTSDADPPGSNMAVSSSNSLRDQDSVGPSRENSGSGREESGAGFSHKDSFTSYQRKTPFGSVTTLSSTAPTEASDDNDDHINVVLRVRPLSTQEKDRAGGMAATFSGEGSLTLETHGSKRPFTFNVVFEPEATQEDLFNHSGIRKLIDMAISGYSCTAFAFGQTGSGKTHTMTGPPQEFQNGQRPAKVMEGIIQRSFGYMLEQLTQHAPAGQIIRASYLEIYNEQVIDLLNPNYRRPLAVRWNKNKGFYVENLFIIECETLDDLIAVLEEGLRNRQMGSHGQNEFSSRSHSMLTLMIDSDMQQGDDETLYVTKRGKITFVDLAGSEKVKDIQSGETLHESNSINKSLLVLGNCISSLGDSRRRHGHIPYRDSKLTKLLADSLGGNGVTLMIACITPSSTNVTETMNTLRYADRAKKIKTKPTISMDPREKLILNLKREIKVLRNENHYLRQQLEFPAKPKGQLQKENDEKFLNFIKEQTKGKSPSDASTDPGLYEMLQEYMVENENLRVENTDMHASRDRIRREQQLLYRENERLAKRVDDLERAITSSPSTWKQIPRNTSNNSFDSQTSGNSLPPSQYPPGQYPTYGFHEMMPHQAPLSSPRQHQTPMSPPRQSGVQISPQRLQQQQYYMANGGSQGRPAPQQQPHRPQVLAIQNGTVSHMSPHMNTSPVKSNGGGSRQSPGQRRPPHHLAEPVANQDQRPTAFQPHHGPPVSNTHSHISPHNGPLHSHNHSPPYQAQTRPSQHTQNRGISPSRIPKAQTGQTEAGMINDMNDKLREELAQLEGEIIQHQHLKQNTGQPQAQRRKAKVNR